MTKQIRKVTYHGKANEDSAHTRLHNLHGDHNQRNSNLKHRIRICWNKTHTHIYFYKINIPRSTLKRWRKCSRRG